MDDKKNIILAVLLTAAILFGWPYVAKYFFPAANPPATKIEGGKTTPLTPSGAAPAAEGSAAVRDLALALKDSPRVPIRTPKITGSINLKGARIDDIVLPTYKETIAKRRRPFASTAPAAPGTPISPASAGRAKG